MKRLQQNLILNYYPNFLKMIARKLPTNKITLFVNKILSNSVMILKLLISPQICKKCTHYIDFIAKGFHRKIRTANTRRSITGFLPTDPHKTVTSLPFYADQQSAKNL